MGIPWDDVVVIQQGKDLSEPCIVTVNCPDKAGLGCDLCRIILEFGLRITRAGTSLFSTGFLLSATNLKPLNVLLLCDFSLGNSASSTTLSANNNHLIRTRRSTNTELFQM
ncbi:hypothetical protein V8G54_019058 [Vigna mungo]|uniref:ACT domain-containing protein n=1 Tax=Vigna mungo TaxID=3915 RepID=A0AAQ3N9T4_VIGMU